MNKVNPFSTFAAPHPLIFPSNFSNTDEFALVANLGKTSLAKEKAGPIMLFYLNSSSHYLTIHQEIQLIELC